MQKNVLMNLVFQKISLLIGSKSRPSGKYICLLQNTFQDLFFDVAVPNEVHQADLLFLPHDRPGRGRKLYKYALTVVDVASRYKEAEPLVTKEAKEVADALSRIYS